MEEGIEEERNGRERGGVKGEDAGERCEHGWRTGEDERRREQ